MDDNYIFLECEQNNQKTWIAVKASKRGNDKDMYRTEKELRYVSRNIEPYAHYDSTRALKIVVTIDPKRFNNDIESAWVKLGSEFNRFLSVLKRRYGDVSVLRSWESHDSGYPHIHAIVCFEKKRWLVVGKIPDKNGCEKWRIPKEDKDQIEQKWKLGFLDVQAIVPDSINDDIEDSVWYIVKSKKEGDYKRAETWSRKRLLTLAIMWYLGRQGWSCSRKLRRKPDDSKSTKGIIQTDLENNELFETSNRPKYTFVGMVRGHDIGLGHDVWVKIYPDPPDFLDDETIVFRPRQYLPSTTRDMGFA